MSYKDTLGDQLYVAPVNKYVAPAADRDPALTKSLQQMARQIARERPGGITSADVIAALEAADPTTHKRLEARDRRLMGAVFPKDEWEQTGEWRATGSHGRPQRVWILRRTKDAAA